VLARRNRIVEADDFRTIVRRGQKIVTDSMIGYRVESDVCRVGIVITAKVGNAVTRNSLRRKARAISRSMIAAGSLTGDIVFRFRDAGMIPTFATIENDIRQCVAGWDRA
jgi:ribonuclease P protein component